MSRIEGIGLVADDPLAALARKVGGKPGYLESHHIEAALRVRRLVDKSHLMARVTMAYSPLAPTGRRGGGAGDVTDMAAEARKRLAELHAILPRDCAGGAVETDRGWPRRSAKLVLRIGLEQLALHYGLAPVAEGESQGRQRRWVPEGSRPTEVG
jgi:hypothetical protein